MNPSGSFLVEKCFTASNFSHKEAIVSELFAMQNELSRTRHAIYLLKKLDVERLVSFLFPLFVWTWSKVSFSIISRLTIYFAVDTQDDPSSGELLKLRKIQLRENFKLNSG